MPDTSLTDKNIPTNLRLLTVLEEIARAGVPITPTAVNEKLGLPKPTIHRLFHTLEEEGFLQRDLDGRSYGPGTRLRKLSVNVLSSSRVRMVRLSILNALAEEVGETCNIATPERYSMIYLDRVETKWPLRIQLPVGTTVPFHCTASGKMYLSSLSNRHLDKYLESVTLDAHTDRTIVDPEQLREALTVIRRQNFATDDQEFMEGMVAIAVPILDDQKRLMSTLSIHVPVLRFTLEDLKSHLPRLHHASAQLSELVLR